MKAMSTIEGRQRPALSVVLACRDAAPFIGAQLTALAEQEYDGPWEVVVADNGSRDTTVEVVKAYAGRLPGLTVVDAGARAGKSYALTAGVQVSSGALLVFVDADDEVAPGFLSAMEAGLRAHDAVAARLEVGKLNPPWAVASKEPAQQQGPGVRYRFLPGAAGCGLGVRRPAYEAVGGVSHEAGVADDVELCWRLQLAGFSLGFAPDAVVHYRYRSTVRDIYRQAVAYGASGPLLYRCYRSKGMPRTPLPGVVRGWAGTLVRVATATTPTKRAQAAVALGVRVGRMRSSVRNRILYL